ncbi:3-hydroxyisobutyrate dehydrogenase-like beta-hydroxyacid dehydrogenase [Pseudonocardia hierapolitana]|uniref:3-hydroxyisobutyrate dehydrogenase-like beta-hydroxyacid dehydrogenase n=1 Tax=Pseudonocardia hierapolitana TaxID=1128676 RepID=A0A561SR42_9PSEU|nr:NAD(P)-binding domain-containing protein [Pseudonocardia hierapolitana]TWF77327.1 3-hydroxyisobutyrate dehydrogenase-like beta-hydroxyacid dehydrogenase [Pseudonocardia hierapolitana]
MSEQERPPVTVIGLGAMGSRIAEVLLAAGHPTSVWNRTPGRADPLVAQGAVRASGVAEAVTASPLVLVCVLDYAAAREILEPVAAEFAGRTLVHFTTGTPQQAREMARWAAGHGIGYVDSGMMATPPMIGKDGARFLYSGSQDAFERYRRSLELLGTAEYFGEDAGLASLYDLALLSAMYGMFAGFFHGAALVGSAGVSAADFAEQAAAWVTAMTVGLPYDAEFIDSGDYTTADEQTVAFNKSAFDMIVQASREEGVAVDFVAPLQALLARQVAEGHGAASFARVFEGIRAGR